MRSLTSHCDLTREPPAQEGTGEQQRRTVSSDKGIHAKPRRRQDTGQVLDEKPVSQEFNIQQSQTSRKEE